MLAPAADLDFDFDCAALRILLHRAALLKTPGRCTPPPHFFHIRAVTILRGHLHRLRREVAPRVVIGDRLRINPAGDQAHAVRTIIVRGHHEVLFPHYRADTPCRRRAPTSLFHYLQPLPIMPPLAFFTGPPFLKAGIGLPFLAATLGLATTPPFIIFFGAAFGFTIPPFL